MNNKWVPRAIVALLAIASLATTVVLTVMVVKRYQNPPVMGPSNFKPQASDLDPLFPVPAFELTDSQGQPFTRNDLAGTFWVANFFFTQCRDICPSVSGAMARLQMMLDEQGIEDVHLVSFSIDAGRDTPEELAAYGKRFNINPKRWTLLTGSRESVWSLVEKGFKLSVEAMDDPGQPFTHSSSFVLVDQTGQIRRYYSEMHKSDQADRNLLQLMTDLAVLRRADGS